MKNIYTKILLLLFSFVLQLYLPARLDAQCLCAGSVPATPITQSLTIPPTATSTLNFAFQQFNPSIGTLSCITFTNTVTGISYPGARNTNIGNDTTGGHMHIDSTAYLFSLTLSNKITGPGVTVTRPTYSAIYGYDTLAGRDTLLGIPGDTVNYGPVNFITNPTTTVNLGSGSNFAYTGMGSVNFAYTVNGGMITLDGGANYNASIASTLGGTLELTYYWCPATLLASGLQHFSAYKKDNNIILKWDAQNTAEIDQFDIEYSVDGITFTSVAKLAANHGAAASTYNYNYALNGNSSGYVYFRIKQTGNDNKAGYSAIQKILLNEKTGFGISIHPNPVTTGMSIAFDHPLNGNYSVDLVNLSGQVVINKKMKLMNTNTIPVSWSSKPAPGIYFTRITNTASLEQQIVRVIIQ